MQQIAPSQTRDGVDRVKIRDRSGVEGWVTPDARPLNGELYFEIEKEKMVRCELGVTVSTSKPS